uniref:Par3/HAL N-terminal domain-containing protein n=1 Tax=Timema cristinae TaxID=61476 RepID=A0A7R9GUB9_TIMCR|nr:unnamed protein product [Timema cristinae]
MKISANIKGEWVHVPCKDGNLDVQWLGEETLRRYHRLKLGDHDIRSHNDQVKEVRRAKGGAWLDPEDHLADILDDNDFVTVVVYGITTGFGNFARTVIDSDKLELCFVRLARHRELQYNLIRSHAAGVGTPLSPEKTRMLLALRINVLAKGHSGISLNTLNTLIAAFNASCLSMVPEQGSVGASGDLAPLAHLALGLLGEGEMWSPKTGWENASKVLEAHGLKPLKLSAKEGIALINGTQLITSLGAEAVERAYIIALQADVVAALTLEVLKGTSRAFDSDVQLIRPHKGQIEVARRLRALLHSEMYPSQIAESHRFCNRVQDAYTLRCCPQVHGIVHDTIDFVEGVITVEINILHDTPLHVMSTAIVVLDLVQIVFAERGEIISAGNFHGEYPAKALDYLAVGVHELASMSERRIERLVNPGETLDRKRNRGGRLDRGCTCKIQVSPLSELPAFLVKDGGLNSGFMLAHCTAAALVSENKVLCHPASVDSLSTSAGTEDHVSMGGYAARKSLQVLDNVERVIAIELLAACQAIEFLRPLKTTVPLEEVYNVVRSSIRLVHEGVVSGYWLLCSAGNITSILHSVACQAIEFLRPLKTTVPLEEVYNVVLHTPSGAFMAIEFLRLLKKMAALERMYSVVLHSLRPWDRDRFMSPDIETVTQILKEGKIWEAVRHHIDYYHAPEEIETRVFSPTAVMVGNKQRARANSESVSKKMRIK